MMKAYWGKQKKDEAIHVCHTFLAHLRNLHVGLIVREEMPGKGYGAAQSTKECVALSIYNKETAI